MTADAPARVLVAGIGNIFLGDDAFGVEVVRRLHDVELPESVDVVDYGIRGVHLAYDLLDGRYDVLLLVDAVALQESPGTIGVLEVDLDDPEWTIGLRNAVDSEAPDAHGMDPESTLRLVATLGGRIDRVVIVGCQPAALEETMELSEPVTAAIEPAVLLVARLAAEEASRSRQGNVDVPAAANGA